MMKMQNTTYNALNMRGLKELPPPLCKLTGITTTPRDTATSPLLHKASASCGRVFLCLFLAMFAFTFTACEKEISYDYPEIVNNVNHVLFGVWINTEWDGEEHLYY